MSALDVLVKYGVGEQATEGAWGELCRFVHVTGTEWASVEPVLAKGEEEFKERTGARIPPAYRTAKSVLKNAMEWGVLFMDENGMPLGKTHVERATKVAKALGADTREEPSWRDVMDKHITCMRKAYNAIPEGIERDVAMNHIQDMMPSIWGH